MGSPTVITDAAGVATAVGVLFGAAQLFFSRTQARTTFEDTLSGQYRQVIKPRLVDGLLEPLSPDKRETVAPYYAYLDLCNEQVFLRMQGRVGSRTWNEWKQGIQANLKRGGISDAWNAIAEGQGAFSDFQELRLLCASDFRCDPRAWNPLWRRILRCEQGASEPVVQQRAGSARGAGASMG
jgi:hypothetical protein